MAKNKPQDYNLWRAVTEVSVEALRKGQLLALGMVVSIILLILKTPNDHIPKVWDELFALRNVWGVGSLASLIIVLTLWFRTSRARRVSRDTDYERVVAERNWLQEQRLGKLIESSEAKVKDRND